MTVDLPNLKMVTLHSYVNVYQMVLKMQCINMSKDADIQCRNHHAHLLALSYTNITYNICFYQPALNTMGFILAPYPQVSRPDKSSN